MNRTTRLITPLLLTAAISATPATRADIIYGTDISPDNLVTISAATGTDTTVGALGAAAMTGLAFDRNTQTLYGIDNTSDGLYSVNTATGMASTIGGTGVNISDGGLAFDPNSNTLYGTSILTDRLYSFNTTTGAATDLGGITSGHQHSRVWRTIPTRTRCMGIVVRRIDCTRSVPQVP